MAAKHKEQYDRMMRWYARIQATASGREHTVASDNYVDEIYAFFLNCYHLKDWIKNDPTVGKSTQQQVEKHINDRPPLRLCADLCNSLKHLVLTSPRSNENPAFGNKQFSLELGTGPAVIALKYEVVVAAGSIDAFQLATECVDAWDTFYSQEHLS